MEEDNSIKTKRIIKKILNILSYVFITVLMLIAAFLVYYVVCTKIAQKKGENPSISLYTIVSPSMVPAINVYDVVVVKKTDVYNLKEKDIITFYSTNSFFGNTPITHRIIEVNKDESGKVSYRVKGDANNVPDTEKVLPEKIIGKVAFRIKGLGKIQYFITSKKGYLLAIILPSSLIVIYDIYKIIRLLKLKKKINEMAQENINQIDEIESNVNNNSENIIQSHIVKEEPQLERIEFETSEPIVTENNNIQTTITQKIEIESKPVDENENKTL